MNIKYCEVSARISPAWFTESLRTRSGQHILLRTLPLLIIYQLNLKHTGTPRGRLRSNAARMSCSLVYGTGVCISTGERVGVDD